MIIYHKCPISVILLLIFLSETLFLLSFDFFTTEMLSNRLVSEFRDNCRVQQQHLLSTFVLTKKPKKLETIINNTDKYVSIIFIIFI